jgi:hypothetical protein
MSLHDAHGCACALYIMRGAAGRPCPPARGVRAVPLADPPAPAACSTTSPSVGAVHSPAVRAVPTYQHRLTGTAPNSRGMAGLPWVLQQHLGLMQPAPRQPATTGTPAAATFGCLNWDHTENGVADPTPVAGQRTLVTRCNSDESYGPRIMALVGGLGYARIRDDGTEPGADDGEEPGATHQYTRGRERVMVTHDHCGSSSWAFITLCPHVLPATEQAIVAGLEATTGCGSAVFPHNRSSVAISLYVPEDPRLAPSQFALVSTTGTSDAGDCLSVKFSLRLQPRGAMAGRAAATTAGNKRKRSDSTAGDDGSIAELEVAKGLFTFSNGEMDFTGPTLEMLEVAKEWQSRGVGRLMYEAMERAILAPFKPLAGMHECGDEFSAIPFSACNVTSGAAFKFFQNMNYQDADGMGEELMKTVHFDMDEGDYVSQGPWKALSRAEIDERLVSYNRKHRCHIAGAEVRASHRKPCTACGKSFDEWSGEWYYTDRVQPYDADKFCTACMAEKLGGCYDSEGGREGEESDDY